MLLLTVKPRRPPGSGNVADERSMEFADDVPFEAPNNFPSAEAFLDAFEDAGAGGVVVPHADEDDAVAGRVSGAVPVAAKTVLVGLAVGLRQRRRSGEAGACRFGRIRSGAAAAAIEIGQPAPGQWSA